MSTTHTASAAPAPEPTAEQLALAYRQLRHPNTWPSTLAATVAHPIFGKCLRAMARQMNRPAWWQPTAIVSTLPRTNLPPVPPTPVVDPAPKKVQHQGPRGPHLGCWQKLGIDMKRAAANDRDD